MARRSDHSRQELKTLILDAAWQLVETNGVQGLTARRIAGQIGYAPGTIYNIFPSMDELCLSINARTLDLLHEALNDPHCHDPDALVLANLKAMANRYTRFAQAHRPHWLMLFTLSLSDTTRIEPWYMDKVERLFTPLESVLTPLFDKEESLERQKAARVLWSSVHGLCFLAQTGKLSLVAKPEDTGTMTDYLVETFMAGMTKRSA